MTRSELETLVATTGHTPEIDDRDEDLLDLLRDNRVEIPTAAGITC